MRNVNDQQQFEMIHERNATSHCKITKVHHWPFLNVHSSPVFYCSIFLLSLSFRVTIIVTLYSAFEVTLRYLRNSTN